MTGEYQVVDRVEGLGLSSASARALTLEDVTGDALFVHKESCLVMTSASSIVVVLSSLAWLSAFAVERRRVSS